jgi:hypothetical protein
MARNIVVQRMEEGNRQEYQFPTLEKALEFIKDSERKKKTEDGYKIDGGYEIYMPRLTG